MALGMIGALIEFVEGFGTPAEAHGVAGACDVAALECGFLVQAFVEVAVGGIHRTGQGAGAGGDLEGEGDELIEDLLAGMQGRHAGRGGKTQGEPASSHLAVAQLNPIVAVAHRHRQVPLGGMAVDRDLLKGMEMAGAAAQAGDIGHPQAELAGTRGQGLTTIPVGNVPEHIGPLGIPRQEHHLGLGVRSGGWQQASLDLGQARSKGSRGLRSGKGLAGWVLADGFRQLRFGLAAVRSDTKPTGDLAELSQGHSR